MAYPLTPLTVSVYLNTDRYFNQYLKWFTYNLQTRLAKRGRHLAL